MLRNKLNLTEEQSSALELIESGENVLLTGKAGTGKSTVISAFRDKTDRNVAFVAPTGVAAVNIGGVTAHSLFQIKPGCFSDLEPIRSDRKRRLLQKLDVVVLEEISMVRSDLLTAIDQRLREVARGKNHGRPFGGVQVVAVGDFSSAVSGGYEQERAIISRDAVWWSLRVSMPVLG